MSASEMAVVLLLAVLSFFAGSVWGVFVSGRNWRRAGRALEIMHSCAVAMAGEILRLRALVSSLGGDPGPEHPAVSRSLGGEEER